MKKQQEKVISNSEKILGFNSNFTMVESYKSIRTNIMYSLPKTNSAKVIVVTSSSPSEGKTTTCVNLALTFAQIDAKILLIDCDLRKPKVHRYLNLERKAGISNVLCGFADLDSAIKKNVREKLDVLTSGETPPNPAELLESSEFEALINILKERYDYIFIDTPPINVVTDAAFPIKHSTGTVIIIKKEQTTYEMLDEAMDKLNKVNANIIGTILIDKKDSEYGYKHGYSKQSYYAEK